MAKNHRCSIWIAVSAEGERSTISERHMLGQVALLKRNSFESCVHQAAGIDLN